ncbi:MAG: glycerol-3-phosphate ABC transporter substrate-binding protein [Leptolyngbya sp.]|nr:MAG: glycerol-3-phosphate ABC transporter substrate-binding protein [Leptolyngbya sp.]
MLTTYKPEVFENLDTFESAREQLEDKKDLLPELGDVIRRHGLNQQIGISLLHKHFDLTHEERLVEEFADNHAYIKPSTDCNDSLPYMWKLEQDEQSGERLWVPLEFVDSMATAATTVEQATVVANNPLFLKELAEKLSDLNVADLFGFSVLHRDEIHVAAGNILVESTDEDARVLTFSALPREKVDPTTLTQTLWKFPTNGGVECVSDCDHCTHCTHCTHCDH